MDDPVEIAWNVFWENDLPDNTTRTDMCRALIAALESKADSLSAPLPGNAYPLGVAGDRAGVPESVGAGDEGGREVSAVTPAMRRALQYAAENGGSFKFWTSGTFSHRTVARCRNAGLLKEIRPQGVGALKWELTDLGAAALHP